MITMSKIVKMTRTTFSAKIIHTFEQKK